MPDRHLQAEYMALEKNLGMFTHEYSSVMSCRSGRNP